MNRYNLIKENDAMTRNTVKASQGIKSTQTLEELDARKIKANQSAQKAQEIADDLSKKATTKNEKKVAKVAQTRADKARIQAERVTNNADNKEQEIIQTQKTKAKNIQEYKSSPNYKEGLKKQQENSQKQHKIK